MEVVEENSHLCRIARLGLAIPAPGVGVYMQLALRGGLKDAVQLAVRVVEEEEGHARNNVLDIADVVVRQPWIEEMSLYMFEKQSRLKVGTESRKG